MSENNKQKDARELAEIVENSMAEFKEAMRLREELSIRIGRRTSQIIRFGTFSVALLSVAIVYLTASLNADMARMVKRMDQIAITMTSMEGDTSGMNSSVTEMNQAIQTMPQIANSVTVMSAEVSQMKQQMHYLNGNVGAMGYEVNRMAAPTKMFPMP